MFMKKVVTIVVMIGALSQITNAMGPTGDTTRRHFYKDQEWIWHSSETQSKADVSNDSSKKQNLSVFHVWNAPLPYGMPARIPLAFGVPTHPPTLAFGVPTHPPTLAFGVPTHPPTLAFGVPTHPPTLAFGVPTHPPGSAFRIPLKPS
jgi:hypothetical protein